MAIFPSEEVRQSFESYIASCGSYCWDGIFEIDKNNTDKYSYTIIEHVAKHYLAGWEAGVNNRSPDTRFGIKDEIKPELLSKRIQDWG